MNKLQSSRLATARQVPGRWLFVFPVLLLVAAGWFALHPWQSSASSPVGQAFSEDLYSPDRYRVLPDGMIEDTATGLVRKLESGHVGTSPSAADIRAFISLTDDQRADLRDGVGPRPVRLLVGSIGVSAEVIPIGLDVNRALAVPRDAQVTGWWSGGSVPGESGPTVIVGHFDSKVASGVFAKLQTLRKGARISIEDSEGSKYVYEVVLLEYLHKTAFPTKKVYGATDGSTLRLVTCGGKFNRATGHYVDNTIAYAVLISAEIVGRPDPAIEREDFPPKISPVFPLGRNDEADGSDEILPDLSLEDFPALIPGAVIDAATASTIVGAPTSTVAAVLAAIPSATRSGLPSLAPSVVTPTSPLSPQSTLGPSSTIAAAPSSIAPIQLPTALPVTGPPLTVPPVTVPPASSSTTSVPVPTSAPPDSPEPASSNVVTAASNSSFVEGTSTSIADLKASKPGVV